MKLRELARRWLPLFGGLVDCSLRDHWESIGQVTVVTVLSTVPIWLATLILFGESSHLNHAALVAALCSTIAHGELFMYSTALLAPLFWIALVDPRGAGHEFPSRVSHMLLIAIIDLIAGGFFGQLVSGSKANEAFIFQLSVGIFMVSLVLLYLGTVYHVHQVPDVRAEFRKQEDEFSSAYGEHRQ